MGLRSEVLYVIVMIAAGLVTGVVVAAFPALGHAKLPPMLWILGVSLIFDLSLWQVRSLGHGNALPMVWRVGGFVLAVVIYLVASTLLVGRIW